MKPEAQAKPADPSVVQEGDAPAAPNDDQAKRSQESDLEELRRFRVRTVPPDMRRQWILAETPSVSAVELQDTLPPKRVSPSATTEPDMTPRPFFNAPRVSSRAPTMRLDRVVRRRGERWTNVVIVVSIAVAGLAVLWFFTSGSTSGRASVAPAPAVDPQGAQPESTKTAGDPPEIGSRLLPALATSTPVVEPTEPRPIATPINAEARPDPTRKDPRTHAGASGRIPASKPKTEGDIKTPLFGQ